MAGKVIEILGIVDDGGGGGSASAPYTRDVQFSKWREVGGPISSTSLYVKERCNEDDIRPWMRSTKQGQILRMRIRFTKQYVPEQLRGKVVEYLGKDRSDKELRDAAREKRPLSIDAPGIGTMRLNRSNDSYEGVITVKRSGVPVEIETDRPKTLQSLAQRFTKLGVASADFQKRLSDILVRDLLPLWNKDWRDEGAKPMTPATLRKSVALTEIVISARGSCEFIFDDGDVFQGHDLVVRGDLKKGPQQADLDG